MGRLKRLRADGEIFHLKESAFVSNLFSSPESLHQFHSLFSPAPSTLERHLHCREIILAAAEADSERHPPSGKEIERGHGLGEQDRMPDSGEQDRGAEPDLFGDRGGRRKESERFEIKIRLDRKSTRLNSSHVRISYAVFCLTTIND